MPSWNIHTAHAERLLDERGANALGIADANAFLFGSYAPDIYLGFMVADTTFHLDYCLTHLAKPAIIPLPDADRFWEECIEHPIRRSKTSAGMSLALGAWAHLVADHVYNERFRAFCATHEVPEGDELRKQKQADFALFARSLATTSRVAATPELLEAAQAFRQYSILADDARRTIDVAASLLGENATPAEPSAYQLLSAEWMAEAFDACHVQLVEKLERFAVSANGQAG